MARVPIAANGVGIASVSSARLQQPDLRGTGLDGVARGMQEIGVASGDLVATLHQLGVQRSQVEANDADMHLSAFANALQTDPKTGILSLSGKAAVDAYQPTVEALAKQKNDLSATLKTPLAKQIFGRAADERLSAVQAGLNRHVAIENARWRQEDSIANIESNSSDAIANPQNTDLQDLAVTRITHEYAAMAARGDVSEARGAQLAAEKVSQTRLGVVRRIADASPDAAESYKKSYLHQLTGGDAGKADDEIRIARDRQEAEQRRVAAEARAEEAHQRGLQREQLQTLKSSLDGGAGTSADWETLAKGYQAIGDTSSAVEAHGRGVEMRASDAYRGAALPEIDQRIGQLETQRAMTPDQAAELKGLRTRRDATAQRLSQPGGALAQLEFATGRPLPPLDPRNAQTYADRAQRAVEAARTYGRQTIEPLTQTEAQPLKDLASGDAGSRLSALTAIAKFGDPRAIEGAARQIAGEGDGSFRVAATLINLPGDAGYQAARDILRGPDAAKTNGQVFLPADARNLFQSYAAPALRFMPQNYASDVLDAAKNLYTARMTAAGETQWRPAAWQTAIDTVLGGYRSGGNIYGGVANFHNTPVSLPPGWTSDGLFRRVARATGDDWKGASVGATPIWPDGSPVYSAQLRDLTPARLGGTRYGLLTRNGRFLTAKGGGPYIFDAARMPWR